MNLKRRILQLKYLNQRANQSIQDISCKLYKLILSRMPTYNIIPISIILNF